MENNIDKQENNRELSIIAKGAGIFTFGRIIGVGLSFITTLILVRFWGAAVFGLYSLGLIILSIFSLVAQLGLSNGSLKYIALYWGKKNKEKTKGVIIQSIIFPLAFGLIIGVVIYIFSHQIANIFQKKELIPIIQLFAIAVPFSALLPVLGGITRGFKTNKYQVLAVNIIKPITNIGLILFFIFCSYNLLGIIWAHIISIILGTLFLLYSIKKIVPGITSKDVIPSFETKKLLSTSVPLLAIGMISFLIHWTDTLMVGYFLPTESVGIYRVAIQIATLVAIFLSAFNSIFASTISDFYHKKKKENLNSLFKTITRWGFYSGLLIFLIILISPNEILKLFGQEFIKGKNSLLILSLGQLINVGVGATGFMLNMTGREKIESLNAFGVLVINIILNLILIPKIGILGAAIATATSLGIINILRVIEIHFSLKIHPFDIKFLKGIGSGVVAFLLVILIKNYLLVNTPYLINLILSSLFVSIIFFTLLFFFKFTEEDKFIFRKIKNKIKL